MNDDSDADDNVIFQRVDKSNELIQGRNPTSRQEQLQQQILSSGFPTFSLKQDEREYSSSNYPLSNAQQQNMVTFPSNVRFSNKKDILRKGKWTVSRPSSLDLDIVE